jgi:hypothetical protein
MVIIPKKLRLRDAVLQYGNAILTGIKLKVRKEAQYMAAAIYEQ